MNEDAVYQALWSSDASLKIAYQIDDSYPTTFINGFTYRLHPIIIPSELREFMSPKDYFIRNGVKFLPFSDAPYNYLAQLRKRKEMRRSFMFSERKSTTVTLPGASTNFKSLKLLPFPQMNDKAYKLVEQRRNLQTCIQDIVDMLVDDQEKPELSPEVIDTHKTNLIKFQKELDQVEAELNELDLAPRKHPLCCN